MQKKRNNKAIGKQYTRNRQELEKQWKYTRNRESINKKKKDKQ